MQRTRETLKTKNRHGREARSRTAALPAPGADRAAEELERMATTGGGSFLTRTAPLTALSDHARAVLPAWTRAGSSSSNWTVFRIGEAQFAEKLPHRAWRP